MNPRDADPLDVSDSQSDPPTLRPWLLRYVLVFGLICAVLYVLNLTTLVIALVSVIVFAAGYYQGWKDAA